MTDLLSIAPMLDCTDRHFRYLVRLITRRALLYTEMLTINEIKFSKSSELLAIHPIEHPIAIQLGGSDEALLAECTKKASDAGFDEINLNVGCPSSRVQSGKIGACLMLNPGLVADCIAKMQQVTHLPVTVKCRLGVDDADTYVHLHHFIKTVSAAGCQKFIIHARKAWLKGLSPKQNRTIPPLDYQKAYQLKQDFPQLQFILNGGLQHYSSYQEHQPYLDGIMIGRAAYQSPYSLSGADRYLYGDDNEITEQEVVLAYRDYVAEELLKGTKLNPMIRPLLGLFNQRPGVRSWRRHLSMHGPKKDADCEIIDQALVFLS